MRNRIEQYLRRAAALSVVLLIMLENILMGASTTAYADEQEHMQEYDLELISNASDDSNIHVYEIDGEYYIDLQSLASLTRCTLKQNDDSCTLTQGIWSVDIDLKDKIFDDSLQRISIKIHDTKTGKAVPAAEMLRYFNATYFHLDFQQKKMYCIMPLSTVWEDMNVDFGLTLKSVYVNEVEESIARGVEVLDDLILGNITTPEGYRMRAYDEVMGVDMFSNEAVQRYVSSVEEETRAFLMTAEGSTLLDRVGQDSDYYQNDIFAKTDSIEESSSGEKTTESADIINKALVITNEFLFNRYSQHAEFLRTKGDVYMSEIYSEVADSVHGNIEEFTEGTDNLISAASIIVNTADATSREIQAVKTTGELIPAVMWNSGNAKNIPDINLSWVDTASIYSNNLTIASSNMVRSTMEYIIDEGIDKAIAAAAQGSSAAAQLGLIAGQKLMNTIPFVKSGIEESKAELSAIILNDLQKQLVLVNAYNLKETDFKDTEGIRKLLQSELLYCQTTVALYEEMLASHEWKSSKSQARKKDLEGYRDKAAISMYKLSLVMENLESAVPADIKEVRAELKETESFWLTPKVCNTDIIVNDGDTEEVIEAAKVSVDGESVPMSKGKGTVELKAGKHTLVASADGYDNTEVSVNVYEDQTLKIELRSNVSRELHELVEGKKYISVMAGPDENGKMAPWFTARFDILGKRLIYSNSEDIIESITYKDGNYIIHLRDNSGNSYFLVGNGVTDGFTRYDGEDIDDSKLNNNASLMEPFEDSDHSENTDDGQSIDMYNYRGANIWEVGEMLGDTTPGDGEGIILGGHGYTVSARAESWSDQTAVTTYIYMSTKAEYPFGGIYVGEPLSSAEEKIGSLGFELYEDGYQKTGNPWRKYRMGTEEISIHWLDDETLQDLAWSSR